MSSESDLNIDSIISRLLEGMTHLNAEQYFRYFSSLYLTNFWLKIQFQMQ